jgi:hypothetical protein
VKGFRGRNLEFMEAKKNTESYELPGILDELEAMFDVLKSDLKSISDHYKGDPVYEQFWRRDMTRTLFSNIEGFSFIIKKMADRIATANSIELHPADYAYILDQEFKYTENGKQKKIPARLGVVKGTVRSVEILAKACEYPQFFIDETTQEFATFERAKEIRHRITHPKNSNSFFINDEELQDIRKVQKWYFSLIENSTKAVIQMVEKRRGDAT